MSQQIVKYLGDSPVLFLDISSTCTGFVVAQFDNFTKVTKINKIGVLWFHNDWAHGQKYKYLRDFITDVAYMHYKVNEIVSEKYFCNPNGGMGTAVVSEATGAVKSACFDVQPTIGFYDIGPSSWRSILNIKKDKSYKGSKAWKEPTKVKVEEILGIKLPEKIISNINGKERTCPTDLWDALGICLAWLTSPENGCTKFEIDPKAFEIVTV